MTFEQFISNPEQIEAHWQVFSKIWNDDCLPAMRDSFPERSEEELDETKGGAWLTYLQNRFHGETVGL